MSVINLTLKVICHFGEFTEYNVGGFNKLIGKDIIIAHRLLKNEIAKHEYWLITSSLSEKLPKVFKPWMQWELGSKKVDQHEVIFHFTQLSQLKKE